MNIEKNKENLNVFSALDKSNGHVEDATQEIQVKKEKTEKNENLAQKLSSGFKRFLWRVGEVGILIFAVNVVVTTIISVAGTALESLKSFYAGILRLICKLRNSVSDKALNAIDTVVSVCLKTGNNQFDCDYVVGHKSGFARMLRNNLKTCGATFCSSEVRRADRQYK